MGEKDSKISTIVLKVDLECQRCYKKIRKVLCKIQDQMNIKTIAFDEKSNTVTIAGPFDAEMVCKKLCCKAGRAIKETNIKGKESKDSGGKADAKTADKAKEDKSEKEGGKMEKEGTKGGKEGGKADNKKEAAKADKDAKPNNEKDEKSEKKKVTFEGDKPKADIGPLLQKMMDTMAKSAPPPPCGQPIAQPAVAQGVAAHSIWPAPASSVAGYSYNPSYDPSYYGGGGYGSGCSCGYGGDYCQCGKPAAPAGGYYGVPVYDNQGWYYGGRQQPYYPPQQQSCCEDPNAGCSVM